MPYTQNFSARGISAHLNTRPQQQVPITTQVISLDGGNTDTMSPHNKPVTFFMEELLRHIQTPDELIPTILVTQALNVTPTEIGRTLKGRPSRWVNKYLTVDQVVECADLIDTPECWTFYAQLPRTSKRKNAP